VKVTIEEFLKRLRKKTQAEKLHWDGVNLDDAIRCDVGDRYCCPITALGTSLYTMNYRGDAKQLGLSIEDTERIVAAADENFDNMYYSPDLRQRLVEAVTL
jgi:hypothetical protein